MKFMSLSGLDSLPSTNPIPPVSLLGKRAGNEWVLGDLASHSRSAWKCLTWSNNLLFLAPGFQYTANHALIPIVTNVQIKAIKSLIISNIFEYFQLAWNYALFVLYNSTNLTLACCVPCVRHLQN